MYRSSSASIWGMAGLVGKELRKVEGSAKWDFYKWLASLPMWSKVTTPVTALLLAFVTWLRHAPWPVWMFLALFFQMAIILSLFVMNTRRIQRETEDREKNVITEPVLDITVVPHGDNSEAVYLEVTNNSSTVWLSAEVRIIDVFPQRAFKGYRFEASWVVLVKTQDWMNAHEKLVHEIQIETSKSKRLKLAHVVSPISVGTQVVELIGIDDEDITWEVPFRGQALPYIEMEIILAGKGYAKPVMKRYKVGPSKSTGPLQMTEITV
jgi:hypothetical protein